MKGIMCLTVIVLGSLLYVPVQAERELTPENTVILSNETDESFCRDFSILLRRVRPEWFILDTAEVPESVRNENLIIIGELDSDYTGAIIQELLQEDADTILNGHYSIFEKENPWADDKIIYICAGSDKLLTKKAAEEVIASLDGEWTYPPFISVPREDAFEYIAHIQYIPEDEELPKETLGVHLHADPPSHISHEEAALDVEYLFYLFSHGYCGYGYFQTRGDFDEAKRNILKELETQSEWSPDDLSQVLRDSLTFVGDCHLKVGSHTYGAHENFWYDTNLELQKRMGEYYYTSDTIYTVVSINEDNPEEYMFPSLNDQGDPIYRIGMLSHSRPEPLVVTVNHDGEQTQVDIQLECSDFRFFSENIFREDTIGGIPVVRIRSFSDHHIEYIDQFLSAAQKYRGEPCLIVDIRGNGGGNEEWPKKWITRLTGQQPSSKRYFTEFISKTTMMGRANYFEYLLDIYPDISKYQVEMNKFRAQVDFFEEYSMDPHWSGPSSQDAQTISNDTTVIVVINGSVASAAEGFINYLRQVENVVLVGENSMGALVFGQMTLHQLPHSKLSVNLPISLNIPLDLVLREEKGFFPDLWVPAEDAVNYAVAAVRKGTITTVQSLPEEVLQEEFIPEKPPMNVIVYLIPAPVFVVTGFVLMLVFKRKPLAFFAFGLSWYTIGVVALSREPPLGYVAIIAGSLYIAYALYIWRKERLSEENMKKKK